MSAGGGEAKRISFGEGHYSTPVWSPRGDLIAFTRIKGGSFGIGVMKPTALASESWLKAFTRGSDFRAQRPLSYVLPRRRRRRGP